MHFQTFWKAALLQAAIVAALFTVLALTVSEDFFKEWGWLTGPIAWLGSAALVGRVLRLPLPQVLTGAVLAGLVSAVFVLIGWHIVGSIFAVPLFALWCARLHEDPELPAETI